MMRRVRFDGKRRVVEAVEMKCTPAQMRIALHRAGLLSTVQDIADSDAEASIVWENAVILERQSPFIDAMKGQAFTDAQIDDLFIAAMQIEL